MEKGLRKFDDFEKHKNLIESFMSERVFNVKYNYLNNKFFIREMCDQWFSRELNKEDCEELSEMFSELANKIVEYEKNPPKEHFDAVKKLEKEKEEEKIRKKNIAKSDKRLTIQDLMAIEVHEENVSILGYVSLYNFTEKDCGKVDSPIYYLTYENDSNTNYFQDVVIEATGKDSHGDVKKNIELLFKKIELRSDGISFRKEDLTLTEKDI